MISLHDHRKRQEIRQHVEPGQWYVIYENLALPGEKPAWIWYLVKEELFNNKKDEIYSYNYNIMSPEEYDTKEECLEEVRRFANEFKHEIVYELKYY